MDELNNPFKELEPDATCPPEVKAALVSEIDLIRNTLQVVEMYAYDIFSVFTDFMDGLAPDADSSTPQP